MNENEDKPVKRNIDLVRQELHKLIEDGSIDSETVMDVSRELDELVTLYYSTVKSGKK